MPIIQLVTLNIDDDETEVQQLKPVTINLSLGKKRNSIKVLDTKIDKLRWEPTVETARWTLISDSIKQQCLELAATNPQLNKELEAILAKSLDDQVLVASWAFNDDNTSIIGWAIVNAWVAQTDHQGALLIWVKEGESNNKVETLLADSILQEVTGYDYLPTVEVGMQLHCQKVYTFLEETCAKYNLKYISSF